MSIMCKMSDKCCKTGGMCGHEKMMLVLVLVMLAGAGHYVFHWF